VRAYDRGANDAAMSRPIWHQHGDWYPCVPRLVPRLRFCVSFFMVGKKGPIVLMVNNFSSNFLYEQGDDVFVDDHRWSDVLLRLRSCPRPYPSLFTFALCRCTLGKDLFCDI
jgi:hypothetical protein